MEKQKQILTLVNDCEITVFSPISGYRYVFKKNVPVEINIPEDVDYLLHQFAGKIVKGYGDNGRQVSPVTNSKILQLDKHDISVKTENANAIHVFADGTVKMGEKIIKTKETSVSKKIVRKKRKKSKR